MDKDFNFKPYDKIGRKRSAKSYISVGKDGRFGFSSTFIRENFSIRPKYCYVNTDQDDDYLYIAFSFGSDENKPDDNRMKLLYPKTKSDNAMAVSINLYKDHEKFLKDAKGKKFKYKQHIDENLGKLYYIEIHK